MMKHPKILRYLRRVSVATLIVALLVIPLPTHAQGNLTDPVDLETFLDGVMAAHLESYHIPGATLSIVHNGEVLLAKGYGYADLEMREEVDPASTLFRPGSVSKLVTWTAVMQLVEQGQLDLHTDVNSYLDFTIPATFPEPITLAHLMTHTPGFEDVNEGLFVLAPEELLSLGDYLKQNIPARVFPPGEVGAYSNYGTALAGYIVERVSGQPFNDYVEEHIFALLGMSQSTFRQPLPAELADQLAEGYGFTNGDYVLGGFEYVNPYPAGSLSTTAPDMAAFMIAHLQEGRYGDATILQPGTVAEMHSRQYSPDPRLLGMTYGFMEGRFNNRRVLHHGGDTFLFHSGLYLVPEENVGLFVSYSGVGGTQARDELVRALMDRYFPVDPPANLMPPAGVAERAAPFLGEYHTARATYSSAARILQMLEAARVSVTPEGVLLLTAGGRTEPYTEIEPGIYRHLLRDDLLTFRTDAEGTEWLQLDGDAPFAFFQPPWYATFSVTMLLLVVTLILFISSMVGWLIGALSTLGRKAQKSRWVHVARWFAIVFGITLLIFLVAFIMIFSDFDPAYGVPRIFFGDTPALRFIMWLPWLLVITAIGLIIFTLVAWFSFSPKGRVDWSVATRLHYTILTVLAIAVLGTLWYWNMLALPA